MAAIDRIQRLSRPRAEGEARPGPCIRVAVWRSALRWSEATDAYHPRIATAPQPRGMRQTEKKTEDAGPIRELQGCLRQAAYPGRAILPAAIERVHPAG